MAFVTLSLHLPDVYNVSELCRVGNIRLGRSSAVLRIHLFVGFLKVRVGLFVRALGRRVVVLRLLGQRPHLQG